MGMYTGFRAKVVVRPRWRDAIALLHRRDDRPECDKFRSGWSWERVFDTHPDFPGLAKWVRVGRRDFIPFGALAYMPDDFSETGESYSNFDPATGEWSFCCSLKNYENEIRTFVETVLARIVESVSYCESLYEEYPRDEYGDTWRDYTTKWLF